MSKHYSDLDSIVLGNSQAKLSSADVFTHGVFLTGLKKRAMDDLMAAAEGAPPPSPYAVPVESILAHGELLVSALFGLKSAMDYYSTVVRPCTNRELGRPWAIDSMTRDLLRHLSNLGAVTLSPTQMPVPTQDPLTAVQFLLEKVGSAIRLAESLVGLAGSSPFRYTVESHLKELASTHDELTTQLPLAQNNAPTEVKVARAAFRVQKKLAAEVSPLPGDIVVPGLETEPPEAYFMREQQLQQAQLANENEFLRGQLQQAQQHAAVQQTAAEQATAQTQELGMQLQQTQAQVEQAQMDASANMELAVSAETNAAAQADAKMRVNMRLQQFRQAMADLVSQDPALEEGAGFAETAGPGAPQTSVQQQQAADQAAAEQAAGGGAMPEEVSQEAEQADRAATEAEVQGAQAEQAAAKVGGLIAAVRGKTADDEADRRERMISAAEMGVPGALAGMAAGLNLGHTSKSKAVRLGLPAAGALVGGALLGRQGYSMAKERQQLPNAKEPDAAPSALGALGGVAGGATGAFTGGMLGAVPGLMLRSEAGAAAGSLAGALGGGLYGARTGYRAGNSVAHLEREALMEAVHRAKDKTAGATERLLAADKLPSSALNAMSDAELQGLKPKGPSLLAAAKGKVRDTVRSVGRDAGAGFAEGMASNPRVAEDLGSSLARGGGAALDESLHNGKMMGYARKAGKGALVVGGLGLGALGVNAAANAYRGRKLDQAVKRQGGA